MKKGNPIIAVLMASVLAVVLCISAVAASIPSPSEDFYVYDGANVITNSTEKYIIDKNKKLAEKTGAQIVIATVSSTEDVKIGEYSATLFTQWGIGDEEDMNGLLVLLAIDDDNYWITQGAGIKDRLTTGNIKTLLDSYLEPYFASGDYSKGVQTLFDKLLSSFESIYSIDLDAEETVTNADGTVEAKADGDVSSAVTAVLIIVAVVVVFVIIVLVVVRKLNFGGRRYTSRRVPASSTRRTSHPKPTQRLNSPPPRRARSNYNGQRVAQGRSGTPSRSGNTNRPRSANGQAGSRPRPSSAGNSANGRYTQR